MKPQNATTNPAAAIAKAKETFGRLSYQTIHNRSQRVEWADSPRHDPCEGTVYPDFSTLSKDALLDWIGEYDGDQAERYRERLAGLEGSEYTEWEELNEKALSGPIISEDPFPHRLTKEEGATLADLRSIAQDNREEWEDIQEDAVACADNLAYASDAWHPLMDHAYPVPIETDAEAMEAQAKLLDTCLTVVGLDDGYALALTGGGMDLSWEICYAHALLGFAPPAEFCDLPKFAGAGGSERDTAIIGACLQTLDAVRMQAESTRGTLEGMLPELEGK